MIIIGLGSGRSGTTSLAYLLRQQENALVFHEMNPSLMRFSGTIAPVLNTIREFEAILAGGDPSYLTVDLSRRPTVDAYAELCGMKKVSLIGDIAFYYLYYVEEMLAVSPKIRFVCLKRDKAETINSWKKKARLRRWRSKHIADYLSSLITRAPFYKSKNFWMEHDGSRWQPDPVWDKCFPKFDAETKDEAISLYYDSYYAQADIYAQKYPDVFRIFSLEELNTDEGKNAIMNFCGFPRKNRNMETVWTHQIVG